MIPLTVAGIARLLSRPAPDDPTAGGLDWRRSHQARARWYHQRTRVTREAGIDLVS
jgi:hypothetical protein